MADEYSFASLSITSSYADEGKREAEEEDMMMEKDRYAVRVCLSPPHAHMTRP